MTWVQIENVDWDEQAHRNELPVWRVPADQMKQEFDLREDEAFDHEVPFTRKTQFDYVRHVARFAAYLGRPPDTATVEDLRQFQVEQREAGIGIPTMNSIVSALRFFFTHTIDRPDLSCKLYTVKNPRALPVVLSRDEVVLLLGATNRLKHKAALSVAYGAGLRAAEVTMLKVRDVDSKRMLLRVERGKGGRYRNALLPADACSAVRG